jgi:anti-sigma regulatory factor (Ser/Thr protein kinase)
MLEMFFTSASMIAVVTSILVGAGVALLERPVLRSWSADRLCRLVGVQTRMKLNLHLHCKFLARIHSVSLDSGEGMAESDGDLVRIADVARELGLSPTRIRQLADTGIIPSSRTPGGHRLFDLGAVRAAVARRTLPENPLTVTMEAEPSWQHELTLLGLSEDVVWQRAARDLDLDKESPAGRIIGYAFTEMLNNAIDHSGSEAATITWWTDTDQWTFEVRDYGVGAYPKLREGLHLASDFEAVQELSKGKRTTDRERHTGEGIFFTSKVVDLFRLTSSGVRWTVDNLRHDAALGMVSATEGTSVVCQIDPQVSRTLTEIFREYTRDHAFVRTRPIVKLFEIGAVFVSRSEARRLLDGLEADFDTVEVDFTGVTDVGQGFVDELLRVWPAAHPDKTVIPTNTNEAVEFMIQRGLSRIERPNQ